MKSSEMNRKSDQDKKPYRPPTLIEYGSIVDLTKGNVGQSAEGSMISDLTRHT